MMVGVRRIGDGSGLQGGAKPDHAGRSLEEYGP